MSEQSTTTNAPSEPQLCKNGCGFFGSNATGDCCSKCWRELQKKEGNETSNTPACRPASTPSTPTPMDEDKPEPEVKAAASAPTEVSTKPEEKKRKKKKKTSYKAMMANMTKRTKDESDIQKEKEKLRNVTGGGNFSKIDRI